MLPTFAIISAVYGVEAYLPDLFRSLDAQTYDHSRIQVILVDDGSLDESGVLCEYSPRWGPSVAGLGASPLFAR